MPIYGKQPPKSLIYQVIRYSFPGLNLTTFQRFILVVYGVGCQDVLSELKRRGVILKDGVLPQGIWPTSPEKLYERMVLIKQLIKLYL